MSFISASQIDFRILGTTTCFTFGLEFLLCRLFQLLFNSFIATIFCASLCLIPFFYFIKHEIVIRWNFNATILKYLFQNLKLVKI